MKRHILPALILSASTIASAAVCDYRPSNLVGAPAAGSVAVGAGATAAAGVGMKAAGVYAITNGVTGSAMLGSTVAGASAAGTIGILSGTAGVIGTVGAALLSPFVIIPAAVTAGVIATYEGGCYLSGK